MTNNTYQTHSQPTWLLFVGPALAVLVVFGIFVWSDAMLSTTESVALIVVSLVFGTLSSLQLGNMLCTSRD